MTESETVVLGPLRVTSNGIQIGLDEEQFHVNIDDRGAVSSLGDRLAWDEVDDYYLELTPFGGNAKVKAALNSNFLLLSPIGASASNTAPVGSDLIAVNALSPYKRSLVGDLPARPKLSRRGRQAVRAFLDELFQEASRPALLEDPVGALRRICVAAKYPL
jgi:hypothetical protein